MTAEGGRTAFDGGPRSTSERFDLQTDTDTGVLSSVRSLLGRDRVVMVLFVVTSLLGSALLFLVQPLVGRLLLPRAGGSASLWNTAMVFFQSTLLAGYLLAHFGTNKLGIGRHRIAQIVLLCAPLATLPLAVPGGWSLDADRPVIGTLAVLTVMVGLPFLALSTASPTLQRWFAETNHPAREDPYFLYAAGNAGAIGALLGYPLIIEPRLGLVAQTRLFTALYIALIVATALCALAIRVPKPALRVHLDALAPTPAAARPSWQARLRWTALAAVPSALLLGVTRHLATDIASFPLLWAIPLTLYLLSFVIAFGDRSEARLPAITFVVRLGFVALLLTLLAHSFVFTLVVHLGWFFAAATLAHLRLAVDRPPVQNLTEFYAWLSVGGALGGGLVALLAPLVFDRVWEYPLAIVAAMALAAPGLAATKAVARTFGRREIALSLIFGVVIVVGAVMRSDGVLRNLAVVLLAGAVIAHLGARTAPTVAIATALLLGVVVGLEPANVVHWDRSFFGTYEVHETTDAIELVSGTTVHGRQRFAAPDEASSYYHPAGPLGGVFGGDRPPLTSAVIGLGAGEMAAYGQPGDVTTFYEIDPVVVDIATDDSLFTHLGDSAARIEIGIGDGRILVEESPTPFDVVVVDAFTSDAIPVHLLTIEAIEAYVAQTDQVVLFHISNRFFDLEPVLGRAGVELGLDTMIQHFVPTPDQRADGAQTTTWVAILPGSSTTRLDGAWQPASVGDTLWTDDYSDILATLTW